MMMTLKRFHYKISLKTYGEQLPLNGYLYMQVVICTKYYNSIYLYYYMYLKAKVTYITNLFTQKLKIVAVQVQ